MRPDPALERRLRPGQAISWCWGDGIHRGLLLGFAPGGQLEARRTADGAICSIEPEDLEPAR